MPPMVLHVRGPRSRIKITKAISSYKPPQKPKYIGSRRWSAKGMFWLARYFQAKIGHPGQVLRMILSVKIEQLGLISQQHG